MIAFSPLWTVRPEPQATRNDAVRGSLESSLAEVKFDEHRRAVLAVLGWSDEEPCVTGGNGDDHEICQLFHRLLDLPDGVVLDVVAVAMGETLMAGSAAVDALGLHVGLDIAQWWQADAAFLELVRDRKVAAALLTEIGGETVAKGSVRRNAPVG